MAGVKTEVNGENYIYIKFVYVWDDKDSLVMHDRTSVIMHHYYYYYYILSHKTCFPIGRISIGQLAIIFYIDTYVALYTKL